MFNEVMVKNMTHEHENLKTEIKSWYPDVEMTDYELDEAAHRLIKFFTIGAKIAYEAKNNVIDEPYSQFEEG